MINNVFGEVTFNSGWETSQEIKFNYNRFIIVVSADAYFESDLITKEQENSYSEFIQNTDEILNAIELLVSGVKYIPVLLIIKRNGEYGLVFDDVDDVDGGIVVTIKPKMEVLSVDQYL